MANTKPALQGQITITENVNDGIPVKDSDGPEESEQVDAGTYDDIHALIVAVETALGGAEFANWTVTVSDEGIVNIAADDAFELLWKTGADHGSDNDDDSIGEILGFDVSQDQDDSATDYDADYQHQYGWYPDRYPVSMGPWNPQAVGGEMQHTLSGTNSKKLHVSFHHTYECSFSLIAKERTYTADATGANANKDLETTWKEGAKGNFVTWYTDASDTASGTKCYLLSPFDWSGVVVRPHTDLEKYDLAMEFREQES